MPHAVDATDAKRVPGARPRRSRLAVEIAVALLVKFVLLYVLWAVWFAHPVSRHLDEGSVAAALFRVDHGPAERRETRE